MKKKPDYDELKNYFQEHLDTMKLINYKAKHSDQLWQAYFIGCGTMMDLIMKVIKKETAGDANFIISDLHLQIEEFWDDEKMKIIDNNSSN